MAGTCSKYSNKAMAQLAMAATYYLWSLKSFRWPYHANVMKIFEQTKRNTVLAITDIFRAQPFSINSSLAYVDFDQTGDGFIWSAHLKCSPAVRFYHAVC